MSKILKARATLDTSLRPFIGYSQRQAMIAALRGEEGEWMADLILDLECRVNEMPKTGETENEADPKVHLHYFRGGVDAWITEKDVGDGSDDLSQYQAFGKINIGYGAELGYISIQELIENDVELDLYWDIKSLKECAK